MKVEQGKYQIPTPNGLVTVLIRDAETPGEVNLLVPYLIEDVAQSNLSDVQNRLDEMIALLPAAKGKVSTRWRRTYDFDMMDQDSFISIFPRDTDRHPDMLSKVRNTLVKNGIRTIHDLAKLESLTDGRQVGPKTLEFISLAREVAKCTIALRAQQASDI